MTKRAMILIGMGAGMVWAIVLVWVGVAHVNLPVFSLLPSLGFAFLGPGIVYALMIGWLAQARFRDEAIIDGAPPPPDSRSDLNVRVLQNTTEQLLLAVTLWPPAAYLFLGDGPGVVICLGLGFTIARIAFWIGYHISPPLRAFGFAATFYPTPIALIWALLARVL
ncbi:MAG: MAPEG family protein [Rhodobacteraceae bacterium]|nr:MAPEG family protein [Paracoccaceae bacterium]